MGKDVGWSYSAVKFRQEPDTVVSNSLQRTLQRGKMFSMGPKPTTAQHANIDLYVVQASLYFSSPDICVAEA